jgi:hypothetical protein
MLARAYQKAGRPADAQKERDTFARLDSQARAKNQGTQSVGGVTAPKPQR